MLCIMCAMKTEYDHIRKYFNGKEYQYDKIITITECTNPEIILVNTGMGREKAERAASVVAGIYPSLSCMISAGIAGGIAPFVKKGDIVYSNRVAEYRNPDFYGEFLTNYNSQDPIIETCEKLILTQPYENQIFHIYKGAVISSDKVIQKQLIANQLYTKLGGICVDMEYAGMMKACTKNGIAAIAIKIISDYADEDAIPTILSNMNQLLDQLGEFIFKILSHR